MARQMKETEALTDDGRLDTIKNEDENVLILHVRLYEFLLYALPLLNKFPSDQRFVLTSKIRDVLYDCLIEIIKYEMSGTISHIYAIDGNIHLLSDLFKIARDTGISVIDNRRIIIISNKLNEIGRLIGGIIRKKKNIKDIKHKKPNTVLEADVILNYDSGITPAASSAKPAIYFLDDTTKEGL